jgi:transcriptional regulator with XRE-family HTH domain
MNEKKARQGAAAQRFAERLNRLFDERRRPDGEKYTYGQVEAETGGELSVAYLSMLCNGGVAHPRMDKLVRLADFFGMDIRYFTAMDPDAPLGNPSPELSAKLRKALENPWTRDFAAKAGDMGPDDYQALLNFWEYTSPLRRRQREADMPQDAPQVPQAEQTPDA